MVCLLLLPFLTTIITYNVFLKSFKCLILFFVDPHVEIHPPSIVSGSALSNTLLSATTMQLETQPSELSFNILHQKELRDVLSTTTNTLTQETLTDPAFETKSNNKKKPKRTRFPFNTKVRFIPICLFHQGNLLYIFFFSSL